MMRKAQKQVRDFVWGKDYNSYNTVGQTQPYVNFLTMQIVRMLICLILLITFSVYTYIYVRMSLYQITYWGLTFTLLAFLCLFIGSGRQVVYQKLVEQKKIQFKNKKLKTKLWTFGIFFYAQALPLVIVQNFLYFVDVPQLLAKLP